MWLLPTYGRPERCQATLDSISLCGFSEGVVWIDGDTDPAYDKLKLPLGWNVIRASRNAGLVNVLNAAFRLHPKEPWYGFISDDSIVTTIGWSRSLVDAAQETGFANSADGWQADKRMHGAIVFGGELLRALGWWAPPGLVHSCCDDAWELIGKYLGNWTHVAHVMVEHRHAWNQKAPDDKTYQKNYATLKDDRKAFDRWRGGKESAASIERAKTAVEKARTVEHRLNIARRKTVMIASPIARAPVLSYSLALAETLLLLERSGIAHAKTFEVGSSKLPTARNALVARFLASSCTDLLMIDDDMGWDPHSVIRALQSPHEFTAVIGRKKCDVPNNDMEVWCGRPLCDADGKTEVDAMGFVPFSHVGAAFMKLSRSVFEKLIAAHPEWKRAGYGAMTAEIKAKYYRFFSFGDDFEETGEDYQFCNDWRAIGGQIWVDPAQWIAHVGEKSYEGAFSEFMFQREPPK